MSGTRDRGDAPKPLLTFGGTRAEASMVIEGVSAVLELFAYRPSDGVRGLDCAALAAAALLDAVRTAFEDETENPRR